MEKPLKIPYKNVKTKYINTLKKHNKKNNMHYVEKQKSKWNKIKLFFEN